MISKNNESQVKDIIYPELNKKPIKNFLPRNTKQIKIIQEQNRLKKQQEQEKESKLNNESKLTQF